MLPMPEAARTAALLAPGGLEAPAPDASVRSRQQASDDRTAQPTVWFLAVVVSAEGSALARTKARAPGGHLCIDRGGIRSSCWR
jgi:hypothetical protein